MHNEFIGIHLLRQYPLGTLPNRGRDGAQKRLMLGDQQVGRISSQCSKRAWRRYDGPGGLLPLAEQLALPWSIQSRVSFEAYVVQPLLEGGSRDPDLVRGVAGALMAVVLGLRPITAAEADLMPPEATSEEVTDTDTDAPEPTPEAPKAPKAPKKGRSKNPNKAQAAPPPPVHGKEASVHSSQLVRLGAPELAFLRDQARGFCDRVASSPDLQALCQGAMDKAQGVAWRAYTEALLPTVKAAFSSGSAGDNLRVLREAGALPGGLVSALFGRMVTGDVLATTRAAIQVAQAFTVHPLESEIDYFTAIDDLTERSGLVHQAELASRMLVYQYVVVDTSQLVSNLTGCPQAQWRSANRSSASRIVESLLHTVAMVSPGAKQGSTAPFACADLVLIEASAYQPRSLAGAFLPLISPKGDVLGAAQDAIGTYVAQLDTMYPRPSRALAATRPTPHLLQALSVAAEPLDAIARWAAARVRGDEPST